MSVVRAAASTSKNGEEDRRSQILRIATALFREKGYNGTSLEDIADRVGFTKPAIYYYFDSKEDLLFAIVEAVGMRTKPSSESFSQMSPMLAKRTLPANLLPSFRLVPRQSNAFCRSTWFDTWQSSSTDVRFLFRPPACP